MSGICFEIIQQMCEDKKNEVNAGCALIIITRTAGEVGGAEG